MNNQYIAGFINDIHEYYNAMKRELNLALAEVLSPTDRNLALYAFLIPFASNISGFIFKDNNKDNNKEKSFDAKEIRIKFGEEFCKKINNPHHDEISNEYLSQSYKEEICLEECEKHGQKHPKYPYVKRLGAIQKSPYIKDMSCVIKNSIKQCGIELSENAIFSNWIQFGENIVFFATDFSNQMYLRYKEDVDRVESEDGDYKYFLDTLIQNFQERWSEHLYYGLTHSTIEYMAGREAIIQGSANDMLKQRGLPEVSIITQLANIEYEGNFSNGIIRFLDNFDHNIVSLNSFSNVKFNTSNLREIRKLLEISKGKVCLDVLKIRKEIIGYGIVDESDSTSSTYYYIRFHGKNSWELYKGQTVLLRFEKGQFKVPLDIRKEDILQKLKDKFHDNFNKDIANIIIAAINQKHGTMVVVSSNAKNETSSILEKGKGKGLHKVDLTKLDPEMITQLCAIDGALMIDPYGNCEGIGLILPNSGSKKGDSSRGARFNSAKAYSDKHKDDFICVISEDGMVDFLP